MFPAPRQPDAAGEPATDVLPVTVVVPTLGRERSLRSCLDSLAACRPLPAEILVVDQGHDPGIASLVASYGPTARLVPSYGRGVSLGRNDGLRAARSGLVLVTDDDCTVLADWVGTAWSLARVYPGAILTGRVLPVGDVLSVPSTIDDPNPRDLSDARRGGVLFGNNMALPRDLVLELGGFDERFGPQEAAEDNEFCYRWLKAGRRLRYEPTLVVEHHDWRSAEELEQLYIRYARGEGFFYAKHLRLGDFRVARFIVRDLVHAVRGLASAALKRRAAWTDSRRGILRGLPGGFVDGWRSYASKR
jgi:GT2 family glycosyltransferase